MEDKFLKRFFKQSSVKMKWLSILLSSLFLVIYPGCKDKNEAVPDPDLYYTCSMDPQVIEYRPGKCPICKMEMTPVKKQSTTGCHPTEWATDSIREFYYWYGPIR